MAATDELGGMAKVCAKQARLTMHPETARALWRLALDYQERAAKSDSGVLPDIGEPPIHLNG
jgi:hypothetical protein